ncbi:MAG: LppP/LprE family lipoprotein [Acidobacteriota bacterium]
MKRPLPAFLIMTLCVFAVSRGVLAQDTAKVAWLDKELSNWNKAGAALPRAPKGGGGLASNPRCKPTVRRAENAQDRLADAAGWTLFGPVQSHSGTVVIQAMSDVDGMCRPWGYQTFVFVNGRFAGTLSPTVMDSRTDGSLMTARLYTPSDLSAEFSRYKETDPLCCASRQSNVSYRVDITPKGPLVVPLSVETSGTGSGTGSAASTTEKSIMAGTVSRESLARSK